MDAKAILVLVVKEDYPTPFPALELSNSLSDAFTTQLLCTAYNNDGCRDNVLHKGATVIDSSSEPNDG
jgi:hypothetical protein